MSKIPRAVVAAGLGVGTFLVVDNLLEPTPQEVYAQQSVNECVSALGDKAISAAALHEACKPYAERYTPSSIDSVGESEGRTITFRLPDPITLLQNESPSATIVDQNIVTGNAENDAAATGVAVLAGLAVAFTVGTRNSVKRLDNVSFGRRKKGRNEA